jgi:hypothetical protein
MNIVLIPGLLVPSFLPYGKATRLQMWLSSGTRQDTGLRNAWSSSAWQALGGQADLPIAAALASQQGLPPGHYCRVDPVHLRVGRDEMSLSNPFALPLTLEEANTLSESLNSHFAADGLSFIALTPRQWLLRTAEPFQMTTSDPWAGVGRPQFSVSPESTHDYENHAKLWQRYLNEIQMLLHVHPLNLARQHRGEPVVNSLWCWGNGALTAIEPNKQLITDCVNVQTVAAQLQLPSDSANKVLYFTGLMRPYLADEREDWLDALADLEAMLQNQLPRDVPTRFIVGDGRPLRILDCPATSLWQAVKHSFKGLAPLSQLLPAD